MESQQSSRGKAVNNPEEENKLKQEDLAGKQPPSASSSPSHEFSFTISLHSSSTTTSKTLPGKTKTSSNSFAIDLSPADDIFFHGHLLPLHLLSHLPVSPRSSTNSLDSFTLPIKDLLDDQKPSKNSSTSTNNINNTSNIENINSETKRRSSSNKSKSFSLFGWRKVCEAREKENQEKQKKRLKFDVSHVLKRYASMVSSLLFFKGRRENLQFHRQPYSFSGNLRLKRKKELRGRRGEISAPASMRTSPSNSGLLLATATIPSSTTDSTMEELQAAIQAAIAHCKNSISAEEKIKC